MNTRVFTRVAKLALVAVLASVPALPGTVFYDDFESGSLSPSRWLIPGSGNVVNDPLNANNKVLAFRQLGAGGDAFTVPLDLTGPTVRISFDYLGLASGPNVGTDTGGFLIVDLPNSFSGYVLAGTTNAGGPYLKNMLNLAVGQWHHIELTYTASVLQSGNGSKVTFEQWSGSANAAGNAFFDNIEISTTPEPGSMMLAGVGMLLVLASRLRRV